MDTIELYRKYVKMYPIQTAEQEREMIERERHDEAKCRQLLVMHNLRAALALGVKYIGRVSGVDDGIQKAMVGLVKASKRFDLDRKTKFISFATMVIRNEVNPMRATVSEKADMLSLSLDRTVVGKNGDGDATLGDFINNLKSGDFDTNDGRKFMDDFVRSEDAAYFVKSIELLNVQQKWKDITISYFDLNDLGMNPNPEETIQTIAKKYGVTRQRISQIIRETLKRLKIRLCSPFGTEECVKSYKETVGCNPDDKERIRHRVETATYIRNRYKTKDRCYVRKSSCGLVSPYSRIAAEGSKEMGSESKRKKDYQTHFIGGEYKCFYSQRYHDECMAKWMQTHHREETDGFLARRLALARHIAKTNGEDEEEKATRISYSDADVTPTNCGKALAADFIEAKNDMESEVISLENDIRKVDNSIVQSGNYEDDGSNDYESEVA